MSNYDPNDFDGPPNPNAIRIEPAPPQEIVEAGDGSLDPLDGRTEPALTKQQIENWRNVLTQMFGPYALIMPESEIYRFKDRIERGAARSPIEKLNDRQRGASADG